MGLLNTSQHNTIKTLFLNRLQMSPLSVSNSQHQLPAAPDAIFELRKNGSRYYLLSKETGISTSVNGVYLYIILTTDPGRIWCGATYKTAIDNMRPNLGIMGHTSLSQRCDVLFAGELHFVKGHLVSWSNASGHYLPPAHLRHKNIIPFNSLLLPEDSFVDYWNMTSLEKTKWHKMRGYVMVL